MGCGAGGITHIQAVLSLIAGIVFPQIGKVDYRKQESSQW